MIEIKDKSGNIRLATPINSGSKRKFQLMKEDYVTLKFSLDQPVHFALGDGIDNEIGIFELTDLYKPVYNTGTGGYDYELRLDAYYWKWKNKKFFYTPESGGREASWSLTATLKTHMEVFLRNLEVLGYKFRDNVFECEIDNASVEQSSKLVSYDNCNLLDALTLMAEAWECEWWITENAINFGRCEFSDPVDFVLGENVESMTRSDSQSTYATRIYAFGSTRNIPSSYRKKLLFDVKKVDGRDIADTARILKTDFFPSSVVTKEEYHVSQNFGIQANRIDREVSNDESLASILSSGIYRIIDNKKGIYFSIGTYYAPFPVGGVTPSRDHLPEGDYIFRASFVYLLNNTEKEILIGSNTIHLNKNQQYDIEHSFPLPANFTPGRGTTQLKLRTYLLVPYYDAFPPIGMGMGLIGTRSFDIDLVAGQSAETSVTFLSGANSGQTYSAVYNPILLTGDDANVIRLPEGITASIGDRYTINNIIKGKVPDDYFSKDDNEITLNGVVQKRLMLPADVPYVDAYENMTKEEVVEEIVVFEDEYAKYIGNTDEVPEPTWEFEKDNNDKPTGNKYPIYKFKDRGLKNFTEDFKLKGGELRIVFQTGKLAGMDFAFNIDKSDDTGTTFLIIRNEDYGRYLPDDVLFPQTVHIENGKTVPADTYILYGFDPSYLSEDMLPNAEISLLKKAKEYIERSKIDPSTYDCKMMSDRMVDKDGNLKLFEIGDKVNLINNVFFETGSRISRIIGFTYNLDIPYDFPVYTVGETAAYSRLGEIEGKIDSLTYKGLKYNSSGNGSSNGPGVYVIGVNDKTLPSDRNVFSSKKSLNTFLNKTKDDSAAGHITFENGILVRKQEIVEASFMSLIEESNDAIVEELKISQGGASTLGEMENVSEEADDTSETNDLLVRLAGDSEWKVDSTLFANVAQLMAEVFPFTISLSGGGTFEKGTTQVVNLSWQYNREVTAQSINGASLATNIRTKRYADVTSNTLYTLSAIYDSAAYIDSVSVNFRLKKYYGVSAKPSLTNEEIVALPNSWAERAQSSKAFDCSGGKYPYYILPTSIASGIQFWIGGLRNTDWTEEVRNVTNAHGYTESYTIFRMNSIQTGVLNIEVK